ncbi:MAG: peptidylprolyl isomerase [Ignavibacteria bacterium]|jgi:peptidyl-prolyl cis-trans isomerase SurA|nr:peptidylprolyl isomerase [Ignavibacteria bacterium]MDH7526698.1 peptidylprolyl isomerase [Ignavibacteria bacterium]
MKALKQFSVLLILLLSILLVSCSTSKKEIVLAEFDKQKITVDEFEKVYAKNNGGYEAAKKDSLQKKRNFLDLYVNFKMKVYDAKRRELDKLPDVVAEYNDYKQKIGVTYLLEKELVEPNIKELYEKRKEELRVSHIMFRPDSAGFEGAYLRALAVLDSIKNGASFEEMAKKYSQDYYSAPYGGDIFYITAGDIIPSFEQACYKLKAGEVYPEPVRTQFGYHLIKVTDRRPRIPEIRASHILIELKPGFTSEDSAKALEKIQKIKEKINLGEDFSELAKEFSEDEGTKSLGGDLGFFSRRMMVQPFDEAAFNLEVGQVSDIVKTQFGYHLIKVTDKKQLKSFEEEKDFLKSIYQRIKYNDDKQRFLDSLKRAFNYKVNSDLIDQIAAKADTIQVGGQYWVSHLKTEFGDSIIITYAKQKISVDTLMARAENLAEFINRRITKSTLDNIVNRISEDLLLAEAVEYLPAKYPQFAELMEEYKNGILIFKLQEEEVWNKIQIDEDKLKTYWEANKEKFQWPDRVEYAEIFVKSDSLAQEIYKMLKAGEIFDSLAAKYTERPGFKEKNGYHGIKPVLDNALSQKADQLKEGEFSEPFKNTNGYSIVKLIKKHPAGLKTFEEALPEVSGAVQEIESKRLENDYIEFLKSNYKPRIYYDKLSKAFVD